MKSVKLTKKMLTLSPGELLIKIRNLSKLTHSMFISQKKTIKILEQILESF
jgi:hypothetical protein